LIWALEKTGKLGPGKKLAIIGGGLAGVTAATAALLRSADVTLIEKNSQVLQLQNKNTTRFIHPHLYDWPNRISTRLSDETDLPCLNWTAAYAGQVINRVERQWIEIGEEVRKGAEVEGDQSKAPASLRVITNCEVACSEAVGRDSKGIRRPLIHVCSDLSTAIQTQMTHHDDYYDCAILAVGFGIEKGLGDKLPSNSYWMVDALEKVAQTGPSRTESWLLVLATGGLPMSLDFALKTSTTKPYMSR
jgi:hypothetical protein